MNGDLDPLTGLLSRAAVTDALSWAVTGVREGEAVAVLYVDLNGFKRVNDGLGHDTGDALLAQVGRRLANAVGPGERVGRMGGDEFVIVMTGGTASMGERPAELGHRIAGVLSQPFKLGAAELMIDASVGISAMPFDAACSQELLRHADAAMYEAKALGGGVVVFHPLTVNPVAHLSMAARLRRAVERDELVLHYQPIFQLSDRSVRGVEALVRWHDPERGLVAPADFIATAERTGVIDALGEWVLIRLCEQARAWDSEGLRPNFGLNVSPRQLRHPDFVRRMLEIIAAHGLTPDRFILELTESAWSELASRLLPTLHELRAAGLMLAIDNFGAGHSSLWRLHELPVQVIKIDRSFLRKVPSDARSTAMFSAMLGLADACQCDVVVEGIETDEQLAFLAGRKPLLGQGYLIGNPQTAEQIAPLLRDALRPDRRYPAAVAS